MKANEIIAQMPCDTGVYVFRDSRARIIYVGKAKNLKERVRSHFRYDPDPKHKAMMSRVSDAEFIVTNSEVDALILEANMVRDKQPRYNVTLKDDKRYPYIKVTMAEDYPRLQLTRRVVKDGSRYFGPYTDVKSLRRTLRLLRSVFPLRTCSDLEARQETGRDCLFLHIGRCSGPCLYRISKGEYGELVRDLILFLSGDNSFLIARLRKAMERASKRKEYERCALLRDRIGAVRRGLTRQRVASLGETEADAIGVARNGDRACVVVLKVRDGAVMDRDKLFLDCRGAAGDAELIASFVEQYYMPGLHVPARILLPKEAGAPEVLRKWLEGLRGSRIGLKAPQRGPARKLVLMAERNAEVGLEAGSKGQPTQRAEVLSELQSILGLPSLPEVIECYDISNISGTNAVGSRVVFVSGVPQKGSYRKYSIKGIATPDDTAMLEEVVGRSLSRTVREGKRKPDLVVVDGGKGQVSAAVKAARSSGLQGIAVVGLAKARELVYVAGKRDPLELARDSEPLKLLQRLRDEAHRFGLAYHRSKRGASQLKTMLDGVKGLGPKRRVLLLRKFGSAHGVAAATEEEISSLPGLGEETAKRIKEALGASLAGGGDRGSQK
jgi:excinuclease ABC subunit C